MDAIKKGKRMKKPLKEYPLFEGSNPGAKPQTIGIIAQNSNQKINVKLVTSTYKDLDGNTMIEKLKILSSLAQEAINELEAIKAKEINRIENERIVNESPEPTQLSDELPKSDK